MNCKEWDDFIEFLPADIAFTLMTAGGAHLTGKLVTKAIGKKLLTKELAKLGIREAFKKGGAQMAKTALMTSAKRLTPKMVGFLAESVAFAEFGMAAQAIRSGDISDITSLDAHMSAVGHSILTLGTIKGVSGGLSMLGTKSLLSKGVAGKIAHHGITTTVDAIALTGVGVGIATMGEGYVSQEELTTMIATGLRDNIALSVGIHAGQGLAKLSLKSAKVAKTMKEQGRFKISKKELASLFTLAGEEAMLGHEFMKNEGASKPTEKMSIDIAEKSTSAKAEAKGERAGIDGNDDEGEETKEGIAQITKEKPFYSWEEDSVDGKV